MAHLKSTSVLTPITQALSQEPDCQGRRRRNVTGGWNPTAAKRNGRSADPWSLQGTRRMPSPSQANRPPSDSNLKPPSQPTPGPVPVLGSSRRPPDETLFLTSSLPLSYPPSFSSASG